VDRACGRTHTLDTSQHELGGENEWTGRVGAHTRLTQASTHRAINTSASSMPTSFPSRCPCPPFISPPQKLLVSSRWQCLLRARAPAGARGGGKLSGGGRAACSFTRQKGPALEYHTYACCGLSTVTCRR